MFQTFDDSEIEEFDIFQNRKEDNEEKKPKLCKAEFSFLSITEDGGLYPCLKMKRCYSNPLGDLTQTTFKDIWYNSDKIKSIRSSLDNKLRDCSICNLKL